MPQAFGVVAGTPFLRKQRFRSSQSTVPSIIVQDWQPAVVSHSDWHFSGRGSPISWDARSRPRRSVLNSMPRLTPDVRPALAKGGRMAFSR